MFQYILKLPSSVELSSSHAEALAIPVARPQNGLMIALPLGYLAPESIQRGDHADPSDLLDPSKVVTVPAMIEEDDGTEALLGSDMEVLLMDFSQEVVFCLRLHDPVTEQEGIQFFFQDSPEIFPSGPALSSEVETWIQGAAEDRVGFYSAVEEELPPRPAARPKGQAAPKKGQKKPSVANLAEQLASLSSTLAPMMSQLQALQEGQRRLEGTVEAAHTQQRTPAYRQSFVAPSPKTPNLARSRFMEDVGPPPRIKHPPSTPAAGVGFQDVAAGEEPNVLPSEEGYLEQLQAAQTGQPDLIPQLLLQQSQALTALVSQLSNQDMLGEIGPSSKALHAERGC